MLGVPRIERGPAFFRSRTARAAWLCGAVFCMTLPQPAFAQFNFFGSSESSVQDVYDSIADHGFRLVGPLARNGNVYVADVLDRSQRRERLIISARSAQILQRYYVDVGSPSRRPPFAGDPPPVRAARNSEGTDNFFSRLTRVWNDDDAPPRPPLGIDNGAPSEAVSPRAPKRVARPRPSDIEPRVATRRDDAPVTSAPLPAPAPSPVQPILPNPPTPQQAPTTASVSPPAAAPTAGPPATSARPTVVLTDPLRIPGERPKEAPKPAETAASEPKSVPTPKPAPKPATPADVPVAPLD